MKKTRLTILSIGPGDPALLNRATLDELRAADPLILRTDHHPLANWLKEEEIAFISLDNLYESTEDFDALCSGIADRVWQLAARAKHPVYAVPDLWTDRTVDCVYARRPETAAAGEGPGLTHAQAQAFDPPYQIYRTISVPDRSRL